MKFQSVLDAGLGGNARLLKNIGEVLLLGRGLGVRNSRTQNGRVEMLAGGFWDLQALGFWLDGEEATPHDETDDINWVIEQVADQYGGGVVYVADGTLAATSVRLRSGIHLLGSSWLTSKVKQLPITPTAAVTGTSTGSNTFDLVKDTTKSWTVNQWRDHYSLRLTSGPMAGQTSRIIGNSATELRTTGFAATAIPGAVGYEILPVTPLVTLDSGDEEACVVGFLELDGGKADQTATNDGLDLVQSSGGTPELFDSHHLITDVLIRNCRGSGVKMGTAVREARLRNVVCQGNDEHGFSLHTAGGTDNWFLYCTAAQNGQLGFDALSYFSRWIGCKAFGNGVKETNGMGAGYLIRAVGGQFVGCDAQENWQVGANFVDAHHCYWTGGLVDANGEHGYRLFGTLCHTNRIDGVVSSSPGLLYQTDYGLKFEGGADRNHVTLSVSDEVIGNLDPVSNAVLLENEVTINNRRFTKLHSSGRPVGDQSDRHIVMGKEGAGGSGNPEWEWKTDDSTPPKLYFGSWDGAPHTFMEVTADLLRLYALLDSRIGSIGAALEHLIIGKAGSGVSGNPYLTVKTTADNPPKISIQTWDGAAAREHILIDHADLAIVLAMAAGKVGFFGNTARVRATVNRPAAYTHSPLSAASSLSAISPAHGAGDADPGSATGDLASATELNGVITFVNALSAQVAALTTAERDHLAAHQPSTGHGLIGGT